MYKFISGFLLSMTYFNNAFKVINTFNISCYNKTDILRTNSINDVDNNTIIIPIVWHILFNDNNKNISEDQLQTQIEILNKDFNLENSDRFNTPANWQHLMGDFNFNFYTNQTIRKYTNVTKWNMSDQFDFMKFDLHGGSNAIDTHNKLNIWVIDFAPYHSGTLLGYAQFPGNYIFYPETDGIVLSSYAVGDIGVLYTSSNKGRTATHEIGHWVGLRHIWGDGGCSVDDDVSDTPLAGGPNFYNNGYPNTSSCGTPDMFMNYMDYNDDTTSIMFTKGQVIKGKFVFEEDEVRYGFSNNNIPNDDDDDDDDSIEDRWFYYIIITITVFSVFFLFILIIKSIITCLVLKWQIRTINQNLSNIS